jgi:hypothetical protein
MAMQIIDSVIEEQDSFDHDIEKNSNGKQKS